MFCFEFLLFRPATHVKGYQEREEVTTPKQRHYNPITSLIQQIQLYYPPLQHPCYCYWLGTSPNALREASIIPFWKRFGGIHLNATHLLYPCIQPHNTTHPPCSTSLRFAHQFLSKIPKVTPPTKDRKPPSLESYGIWEAVDPFFLPIPLKKFGVNAAIKVF